MTESVGNPWLWGGFLALDLLASWRSTSGSSTKDARWSAPARGDGLDRRCGPALALIFDGFVWWRFGAEPRRSSSSPATSSSSRSRSTTSSSSSLVFATSRFPPQLQHRVLFWGILTALVLRAAMIFGGTALLHRFHWIIYVFGAFLVVTGRPAALHTRQSEHAPGARARRSACSAGSSRPRRRFDGHRFFVVETGRRVATPLLPGPRARSRSPTSSSRSTRSRRSSRSRTIRSSSSPRTSSRSSGSARSTSRSRSSSAASST